MFLIHAVSIRAAKKKNRGAFATADIMPGTVIGDYIGTLIPDKDEDEEKQGLYGMALDGNTIILADSKGTGIQTINHSCRPNTALYPVENHTVYFALRRIFKGEEITVNYLLDQPDEDCNPCRHQCFCGEDSCHGSMHCSSRDVERYLKFEAKEQKKQGWRADKKNPARYGTELPPLKNYPRTISDNIVYDLYASNNKKAKTYTDSKMPSRDVLRTQIRETGRACFFPAIGITVTGIRENAIQATLGRI